jgi:hypothetical protein
VFDSSQCHSCQLCRTKLTKVFRFGSIAHVDSVTPVLPIDGSVVASSVSVTLVPGMWTTTLGPIVVPSITSPWCAGSSRPSTSWPRPSTTGCRSRVRRCDPASGGAVFEPDHRLASSAPPGPVEGGRREGGRGPCRQYKEASEQNRFDFLIPLILSIGCRRWPWLPLPRTPSDCGSGTAYSVANRQRRDLAVHGRPNGVASAQHHLPALGLPGWNGIGMLIAQAERSNKTR